MARHLLVASLGALALLQAGCDRAETPAAPAAPGEAPAGAAPGLAPISEVLGPEGEFDALSNTAMSITGDLSAAANGLTFAQGQSYGLSGVARATGADPYASAKASFASLVNVPDTGELRVFKVTREEKGSARNGGLCGKEATTYVVTHQGADSSGAPGLFVLAFKGAVPPGVDAAETDLCGTYMYGPKAGS